MRTFVEALGVRDRAHDKDVAHLLGLRPKVARGAACTRRVGQRPALLAWQRAETDNGVRGARRAPVARSSLVKGSVSPLVSVTVLAVGLILVTSYRRHVREIPTHGLSASLRAAGMADGDRPDLVEMQPVYDEVNVSTRRARVQPYAGVGGRTASALDSLTRSIGTCGSLLTRTIEPL